MGTLVGVFDHVTIRVADRAASERFYETVLTPLGIDTSYSTHAFAEWQDFSLAEADAEMQRTAVLRRNHRDEQYLAGRNIRELPDTIARIGRRIASLEEDHETAGSGSSDTTERIARALEMLREGTKTPG